MVKVKEINIQTKYNTDNVLNHYRGYKYMKNRKKNKGNYRKTDGDQNLEEI